MMRTLLHLVLTAWLSASCTFAFAQNTSIEVQQPWARATPPGASTGAAYLTITNKSHDADRLIGASSDVAAKAQIHEMKVANGIMEMRELPAGVPIPAESSVTMKPGGIHVMLMGLKKPLKAGEMIPLILNFEKAGKIAIMASVRAMGAEGDHEGHMEMEK